MSHPEPDIRRLFERYGRSVLRRCQLYGQDDQEARHLAHQVFLQLHRDYSGFAASPNPTVWIVRRTTEVCLRRMARRRSRGYPAPVAGLPAGQALYTVLPRLSRSLQRAACHVYIDGMELAEAAAACKCSVAELQRRLTRVRRRAPGLAVPVDARPSRFLLERYINGDLDPAETIVLEQRVQSDGSLQVAVCTLQQDRCAFLQEFPYAAFRIEHERRKSAPEPSIGFAQPFIPGVLLLLAVLGALLLWLMPPRERGSARSPGGDQTMPPAQQVVSLRVMVHHNGEAVPCERGDTVSSSASIEFLYEAPAATHMMVAGLDANGRVHRYFPGEDRATLAPLPSGTSGPLPLRISLDNKGNAERYFAVFAEEPLTLRPVQHALERAQGHDPAALYGLALPHNYRQGSFWLRINLDDD